MMSSKTRGPRPFVCAVFAMVSSMTLLGADRSTEAAPTTAPTDPAVLKDFNEVRRLARAGLPDRTFLDQVYSTDNAAWRAAATGDGRAAYLVGICLSRGVGQTVDTAAAATRFDQAARLGSVEAADLLADAYASGRGVDKDPALAVTKYRKAADSGDAEAMCGLAECYELGLGVPKDASQAYRWSQSAAKTGLPKGDYFMGNATFHGLGVPADPAAAQAFYNRAADAGYVPALVTLGDAQSIGVAGQLPDADAAMKLYQKAADAGSPTALIRMASMYASDKLGPRDLSAMLACLKRAADLNDPESLRELAAVYLHGAPPTIDADVSQATDLYVRSANEGDILSLRWVGIAYIQGRYFTKDHYKARHYLHLGADAGDSQCMASLGETYSAKYAAIGFTHDAKAQVLWLQRAVALGNASAMNDLGICFETGDGEPRDYAEALKWFRKGARAGDPDAMNNTGVLYLHGMGVPLDPIEASRWFDMAVRHGDAKGMVNLAILYERGTGVAANGRRAEALLLDAIATYRNIGEVREAAQTECDLCALYLNEKSGVANPTSAQKYATLASAEGNPHGWVMLGIAASTGKGFPKNGTIAFESFQKAAAAHDANGMFKFGECYELGVGCTADESTAADWYHKAVDAGSSDAMDRLGMLYCEGKTTRHNNAMAVAWFRQAMQHNNALGIGHLAVMIGTGTGAPQDIDTATGLARRAELAGHPEFIATIGNIYANGCKSVTKDPSRAAALCREAALYGDPKSKDRLGQHEAASPTTAPVPAPSIDHDSGLG